MMACMHPLPHVQVACCDCLGNELPPRDHEVGGAPRLQQVFPIQPGLDFGPLSSLARTLLKASASTSISHSAFAEPATART